ncbi:MAG: DegT/DnrJ/EryC1/StrS family aminotransferase [Bacteriovoracaceae bacterium]|nr:DegT/DnrJ/EryC1/StrS family aminotransferase [Bacteriovoracaceae bacterium]
MTITFYNFKELHTEEFRQEAKQRISDIIDNNSFIEGEYNDLFEKEFAQMQQAEHCLLTANGTDAIEIALQAYDIGHGDKVGIPGISFFATAEAVITRGACPIFIDIDPETGLMDPESLKRVMEQHNLKAIIPVHIYGLPAPIEQLEKICNPSIKIIEDGAQAQGTILKSGPVGSTNNLITFSFYPTKNLSAFGDAGCILANDNGMAEKIKSIRNHGRSPNGHALSGKNSRCDHMQAAVLHLKLRNLKELNQKRKQIAGWYHESLKNLEIGIVPQKYLEYSSWHLYPVRLFNRDQKYALQYFLKTKDIPSSLFYERSLPEEKPLLDIEGETKNAKTFAANTLCLPMNPFLNEEDVNTVAQAIKEFLANR